VTKGLVHGGAAGKGFRAGHGQRWFNDRLLVVSAGLLLWHFLHVEIVSEGVGKLSPLSPSFPPLAFSFLFAGHADKVPMNVDLHSGQEKLMKTS